MAAPATPVMLTKSFTFSASHALGDKVFGHNYRLHATFDTGSQEKGLTEKIERSLIQKVHSRDLGEHVDFLKGVTPEAPELLRVFWSVIERAISPVRLKTLVLERDSRTRWTMESP